MKTISLPFYKYHGNGNDFIVFDQSSIPSEASLSWLENHAQKLCARNTGIGADGIILLNHHRHPVLMQVINADGSLAKNCGNGLRCATKYLSEKIGIKNPTINLMENIYRGAHLNDDFSVDLGTIFIKRQNDLVLTPQKIRAKIAFAEIGNQHLIVFTDKPIAFQEAIGEIKSKWAPPLANIGFLYQKDNSYHSHVYERGVGFTKSCGSGAAAAAAFLALLLPTSLPHSYNIVQLGGDLHVVLTQVHKTDNEGSFLVHQSGKAEQVFSGIFECPYNW